MIVNPRAAAALAFARVGKLADITVVVVGPDQRDIVGNVRGEPVEREDFLVGAENLRHLRDVRVDPAGEQFALVADDAVEAGGLLTLRAAAGHRAVVNAPHAERIDIFKPCVFADALLPELQHAVVVGDVIVFTVHVRLPLVHVVTQHLLAVRRTHDDAIRVGNLPVRRIKIKSPRIRVHGGPEIIGAQPQQQLKNLRVGLRPDVAHLRLECPARPRSQTPVLVVQEDAAILHRWRALLVQVAAQGECSFLFYRHVRPPIPRRDANHFRQFVHAVNRPAPVAARDDQRLLHARQRILHDLKHVTFPLASDAVGFQLSRCDQPLDDFASAQRADDDAAVFRFRHHPGFGAADTFHVGSQIAGGAHHGAILGRFNENRRRLAVARYNEIAAAWPFGKRKFRQYIGG